MDHVARIAPQKFPTIESIGIQNPVTKARAREKFEVPFVPLDPSMAPPPRTISFTCIVYIHS